MGILLNSKGDSDIVQKCEQSTKENNKHVPPSKYTSNM